MLVGAWAGGCARPPEMVRPLDATGGAALGRATAPVAPAVSSRRLEVGRSVDGEPLVAELFGIGPAATLILGGVHGDEPAGARLAQRLAEFLRQNPDAAAGTTVAVLASANPDGLARRTRTNANRVDLNRNFPARNWGAGAARARDFGGPAAASEPETQAVLRLVEMVRPARILSLHSTGRGRPCNNYDGPAADLAAAMAARNGYPVVATVGHPTPGSLGNWAGVDQGIPIITLELPEGAAEADVWDQNRDALLAAIRAAARE